MIDEAMRFLLVLAVGSAGQLLDGTLGMGFGVFSASMLLAAGFAPVTVVSTANANSHEGTYKPFCSRRIDITLPATKISATFTVPTATDDLDLAISMTPDVASGP